MTSRLLVVVGARPNFVKVAPVWSALAAGDIDRRLLHTGQHYDAALSDAFIDQLGLPAPHAFLGVGSGTHAEQTAAVLVGVERDLLAHRADGVLVAGDVNSTLAAALAAAKLGVPVIHLEAGLRSGDWTMPEEVNRVLTDRLSTLLLCPSDDAPANLHAEGISDERIVVVGNTMIDSLLELLEAARAGRPLARLGLQARGYVLVTLHRPALVDNADLLTATLEVLGKVGTQVPVILPLHPRTRARIVDAEIAIPDGVRTLEPLSYLDFTALEADARLVVTDSGGVQEETTALGVPCLTYRTTTERPVTIEHGTNRLIGVSPAHLAQACHEALRGGLVERPAAIPGWDGHAGPRAARAITRLLTSCR